MCVLEESFEDFLQRICSPSYMLGNLGLTFYSHVKTVLFQQEETVWAHKINSSPIYEVTVPIKETKRNAYVY